ncbi:two-component system sensor histidine kinase SenX3 [Luteococcus japonicus]|uniref:Sensor-like histidine kinase SenX3 n=1 Tax=Luteococcus japonicus TaxID=33984 RepID=A0A3N1ZWY3_9ACTN|nr:ATP-binding protein [Luteococcus japonicus]ROR55359.1 two-component system sensor histidine kinase SenX3 [Luteococcus japonicus]
MTALWILLGLALGLVLGIGVTWWWMRSLSRYEQVAQPEPTKPSVVEPQVVEVVNLLRSAALVIGPHDEVLHSNPQARTLGICRGDRVVIAEVLEQIRAVRRQQEPVVFDTEVGRGIGAPSLHLNVRVSPLGDRQVLVLADDRTPLLRVDETRRDFVANVGHELKTPIGAVRLLAEAVETAADDPEAVRHFAARMQRESARLGELVTQIIDLSRLQADDPMLRAEFVQVGDILDDALARSRELATKRAVNLVRTGDEEFTVLGDRTQLTDALANLVTNAIVYSDEKARVAITTSLVDEDGDNFVEVSVADNGIGISDENQQRIFERFYRVDYGRSRDNGGTGLGLSIVKHIAAVHGGTVNVWSKLGQGSTFTIRLPLQPSTLESERLS